MADDHDRRLLVGREAAEEAHRLGSVVGVEVGGWLVGEDQAGVVGDRSGDRDALLLAAGELLYREVGSLAESESLDQLCGALVRSTPVGAGDVERDFDVLACAQSADEIEVLKDEAEGASAEARERPLREMGDVRPCDVELAAGWAEQPAEHRQKRRLAAAGRAHDQHDLTGADLEVDGADGVDADAPFAEAAAESAQRDQWLGGCHADLRWKAVAGSTRAMRMSGSAAASSATRIAASSAPAMSSTRTSSVTAGITRGTTAASA